MIKSNWKYYTYDPPNDIDHKSSIPITITFTSLSGSTRTYITNSIIVTIMIYVLNYDIVNDNTVKLIDNGANNNTVIKFTASHIIKISAAQNSNYFCIVDTSLENIIQEIKDIVMDTFMSNEYYTADYASADSQSRLSIHYENGLNKLRSRTDRTNIHIIIGVLRSGNDKLQNVLTNRGGNLHKDLFIYVNVEIDNDNNPNNNIINTYDKPTQNSHQNYIDNGSIILVKPNSQLFAYTKTE